MPQAAHLNDQTTIALCFSLQDNSVAENISELGIWLPMIPAGEFFGIDGRCWVNDMPDDIVARFNKKRPFDVEHATYLLAPQGKPAPACGWITEVENRNGEIWGLTQWNDDGKCYIERQQYAFYSPSFSRNKQTNRVLALTGAGLTNDPNLDVPELNRKEENNMLIPKLLLDELGLAEDATAEQAQAAISTLKQEKDVALNRAETIDLNKAVPKATYDIALNRALSAEEKLAQIETEEIESLVDGAIEAGKVAPANKEMYVSLCRSEGGVDQFKAFVASAPAVVESAEKKKPANNRQETNGGLTADEVALCRAMNVSPDSWKANRHHKPTY